MDQRAGLVLRRHRHAAAVRDRRQIVPGDNRLDARVEDIVPAYERGGASAISVLVDERFGGSIDDLRAARAVTALPLLAKGFFSAEEHLRELREAGADAALLILRDLDDETCARLMRHAAGLGLDTLVEAHDDEELRRAIALQAPVVGVNARDLSTFGIDRRTQLALVADRKNPLFQAVGTDIVYKDWSPDFHRLIREFAQRRGIGAVLNTSFNLHGSPIVGSPPLALDVFERSGLRWLALGNFLVQKV